MTNLPVGTLLEHGKYRIVRFIKRGGFGCTYEAEHIKFEKRVAIKELFVQDFCSRDKTSGYVHVSIEDKRALIENVKRKFIDEAKALHKFKHNGIVHVWDFFEENNTAYFVMDFIEGSSLSDIIDREGALPEERVLKYTHQICDALAYVHKQKRLHLDIKPGNIMIDCSDNAVLIDFGTSKQYDDKYNEHSHTLISRTPGYASLEQMDNKVVSFDPSMDIYSLGATLYKMLTGKKPIEAYRIAYGEELEPLPPNVSENTAEAIKAAMQIRKANRPKSIEAFRNILFNNSIQIIEVERPKSVSIKNAKKEPDGKSNIKSTENINNKPHPKPIGVPDTGKPERPLLLLILMTFIIVITILLFKKGSYHDENKNIGVEVENKIFNSKWGEYRYTGELIGNLPNDSTAIGKDKYGTYKGAYRNGVRHGYGVYETSDGLNRFEGYFQDDNYYHGTLIVKDASGNIKYTFKGSFGSNSEPKEGTYYDKDSNILQQVK